MKNEGSGASFGKHKDGSARRRVGNHGGSRSRKLIQNDKYPSELKGWDDKTQYGNMMGKSIAGEPGQAGGK